MKIDKTYTVSLVVAIAFFMQGLDTTAVNTAIPAMARSFNTDVVHLSAGITSYLIALAIFIPVSGWIADRYGTRRVFCTSIVLFITASALCGMSQTLTQFVIFRIFQGMAGAMMTPVGRLAVLKSVTKDKLVTAMAYIVWPALVAPILGPVVGGYLTTYWTWHWIFYLNIPISIICVILGWRFIPEEEKSNSPKKRFDLVGFVLSGSALVGFMYGVELLSRREVPYYVSVLLILVSICLLLFNVRYSKHISNPLIDYSVVRIPTYKVTIFTGSISRMVIGVAPYLIPLMFQEGFGLNPFESGSLFLATMAGNLAMKPATIWVMRHYNFRTVLVVNGFLVALFSFFTALLLPTTPVVLIVVVMFLSGMFRSMQFSAITTLAFAEIPQQQMTAANTLYSTVQQMSTGMGIAMGAVFLRFSNMINGYSEHYTVADFRLAFIFVAILGVVSLYGFTKLTPDAGDAVRVKKRDRNVG
ncbi:DHA2 family efflux MFS transporter permease subunit [Dysgonomonas mossii]|uniref:DHA2 family efflux MFS transporter permease subunit n=1 Tax=Dysgonomonas mossii TaxID=163665 RepID=A0A4Y9IPA7_9BACT|nr:DHA2 family efflux MFS transporter permease subunit [Dysgonomonas mossii]MBF0761236.1 DHA2 family efflux MFS transporter permease subunit [Dysgonomonas mossii]TFU90191.1 DHA2 family efflux MFS transporter permease subunit [Dysgonomonas mossii]